MKITPKQNVDIAALLRGRPLEESPTDHEEEVRVMPKEIRETELMREVKAVVDQGRLLRSYQLAGDLPAVRETAETIQRLAGRIVARLANGHPLLEGANMVFYDPEQAQEDPA
jgi:hypothetical protein